MTCNSCVQLIEKTVGAVDGIIKITVSLDKKEAVIVYNFNTLTDEDVKNAIEDTGFEVTYIKGMVMIMFIQIHVYHVSCIVTCMLQLRLRHLIPTVISVNKLLQLGIINIILPMICYLYTYTVVTNSLCSYGCKCLY